MTEKSLRTPNFEARYHQPKPPWIIDEPEITGNCIGCKTFPDCRAEFKTINRTRKRCTRCANEASRLHSLEGSRERRQKAAVERKSRNVGPRVPSGPPKEKSCSR